MNVKNGFTIHVSESLKKLGTLNSLSGTVVAVSRKLLFMAPLDIEMYIKHCARLISKHGKGSSKINGGGPYSYKGIPIIMGILGTPGPYSTGNMGTRIPILPVE